MSMLTPLQWMTNSAGAVDNASIGASTVLENDVGCGIDWSIYIMEWFSIITPNLFY